MPLTDTLRIRYKVCNYYELLNRHLKCIIGPPFELGEAGNPMENLKPEVRADLPKISDTHKWSLYSAGGVMPVARYGASGIAWHM